MLKDFQDLLGLPDPPDLPELLLHAAVRASSEERSVIGKDRLKKQI